MTIFRLMPFAVRRKNGTVPVSLHFRDCHHVVRRTLYQASSPRKVFASITKRKIGSKHFRQPLPISQKWPTPNRLLKFLRA